MIKEIVTQFGALIGAAILYLLKDWNDKYKAKKAAKEEAERVRLETALKPVIEQQAKEKHFIESLWARKHIDEYLLEILIKLGANRTHILGYHNGIKGFDGLSFLYFSMIAEKVDENSIEVLPVYQSVPCAQYTNIILEIHEKGYIYVDSEDENILGKIHKQHGIKSAYKFRIGNSIAGGSLTISFMKERKFTESEFTYVREMLTKIKLMLEVK